MRTSKVILLISIFFLFAFLQVYIQTETIKLGYKTKQNEDNLEELVDNNRVLRYNISTLESPAHLDKHILNNDSDLKIVNPVQILSLNNNRKPKVLALSKTAKTDNQFVLALKQIFSAKQAEAKTTK